MYGSYGEGQGTREDLEKVTAGPSQEVQALWAEIGLDNLAEAWDAYAKRS